MLDLMLRRKKLHSSGKSSILMKRMTLELKALTPTEDFTSTDHSTSNQNFGWKESSVLVQARTL